MGQIFAALAYYHANRGEIDAQLGADDAECDQLKQEELARRGTP